ncbi:craniofacial development protein 2-like [Temnothorax nylanderi]|uniref:craniofacial development protein 2-like n=1 Tax=Temnothorax nylanderi TaxID=102681 RepID=UPI003A88147E
MAGKLANVEAEMSRLNIDILGLSEVRWPGSGMQKTSNGVIYYSGGLDTNHRYGTAILVNNVVAESVAEFIPLNDRVMMLKLQTEHRALNVIQVYAPTNDKTDAEMEEFYSKIEEAMRLTKRGELTMVIGDFNAKVGSGTEEDTAGRYGLGERNTRGDRLVQFCVENNLLIANTFFKQHPRRLHTWKSPADARGKIIRNQIDFILIGTELRKYVQTVKTSPGADINSD